MAIFDPNSTVTSDMDNQVDDWEVQPVSTDGIGDNKETEYSWTNWTKWYGYYRKTPQLKKAIDAYATWAVGKGFKGEDEETDVMLDRITGWGEDTFQSILWNMVVIKKVNGDAFAEIIRDEKTGKLLNLKPLDPASMKVVVNRQGIIKRYEQTNKTGEKTSIIKFEPQKIFHIVNDRTADEIHGISVVESVEPVIKAREEAAADWRTVLHRNVVPLTVVEIDSQNDEKIKAFEKKFGDIINKKDVLFVPKDTVKIDRTTLANNATLNPLPTLEYLDNFFYQAVGIPRIILGGSNEFTEATAKIAYLTFSQVYTREQRELEADIWNQIGLKITIEKPAEIQNELLSDEAKDKGTLDAAPADEQGVSLQQE